MDIQLHDCPHCNTKGVVLTADLCCPNCKQPFSENHANEIEGDVGICCRQSGNHDLQDKVNNLSFFLPIACGIAGIVLIAFGITMSHKRLFWLGFSVNENEKSDYISVAKTDKYINIMEHKWVDKDGKSTLTWEVVPKDQIDEYAKTHESIMIQKYLSNSDYLNRSRSLGINYNSDKADYTKHIIKCIVIIALGLMLFFYGLITVIQKRKILRLKV